MYAINKPVNSVKSFDLVNVNEASVNKHDSVVTAVNLSTLSIYCFLKSDFRFSADPQADTRSARYTDYRAASLRFGSAAWIQRLSEGNLDTWGQSESNLRRHSLTCCVADKRPTHNKHSTASQHTAVHWDAAAKRPAFLLLLLCTFSLALNTPSIFASLITTYQNIYQN